MGPRLSVRIQRSECTQLIRAKSAVSFRRLSRFGNSVRLGKRAEQKYCDVRAAWSGRVDDALLDQFHQHGRTRGDHSEMGALSRGPAADPLAELRNNPLRVGLRGSASLRLVELVPPVLTVGQ